jgi:two-component system nitrate/nitrite response regulator NarL
MGDKMKSEGKDCVPTFVVEGNRLFREGLKHLLAGSHFSIEEEAGSYAAAASLLDGGFQPDLVLFGLRDDDKEAAADIRKLRSKLASSRIAVLAHDISANGLAKILEAGADAYLMSDLSTEALIQSLHLTMLGEKVFPTNLAKLLIEGRVDVGGGHYSFNGGMLSEREVQILRCLANGEPNKTIANRLKITEATVKVHLKGLLRKINVCNRTQAALWAVAQGIDKTLP